MHYQPIYDIAEICAKKNVRDVVLCPGSRCAPLTLAFTRHPNISPKTFSDERSAAFIGLGMAQQSGEPTVLVCTSGSAAYNFAPAVAEAFFSETPLIVFTADRPAEWIAQHDGQTIYQSEIFGKHVKSSYQLPQDYDHADSVWAINRIVNEAINLSRQEPRGPVHINAPFREPLYPEKGQQTSYSENVRIIETIESNPALSNSQKDDIKKKWLGARRILIVAAQQDYDKNIQDKLQRVSEKFNIPVVCDIISNLNENDGFIHRSDLFLGQAKEAVKESLRPELLITFGKSLVSKNLKVFLRKYQPKEHWHIQAAGTPSDPSKSLTHVFRETTLGFLSMLETFPASESFESQKQLNFHKLWEVEERRALRAINEHFPIPELSELEVVKDLLNSLPENSHLHLANSMSVRYANFVAFARDSGKHVKVYANRGTSGIDGSTSTAVGHSLNSDCLNVLVTGDLAFFYDRNAFWHNYQIPNLRILLLNNHGGLIFNMIDGPASQPEAAEYFITHQKLNASKLCEEFGFQHLKLDNKRKLKNYLKEFLENDKSTKVLEVETDLHFNRKVFDELKLKIKNSYDV